MLQKIKLFQAATTKTTTACIIILLAIQWTTSISATPTTNKLTQLKQQQHLDEATLDGAAEPANGTSSAEDELFASIDNNNNQNNDYQDDLDIPYEQLKLKLQQQHDQQLQQHSLDGDLEWDVLIFTQQWPVTTCYHWREEDKKHECKLPAKKEFWTIHGIWPTKLGRFGPNFCNKTADFDLDQLQRIMAELQQFWPDIDGSDTAQNQSWLWKHEWLKHGTCAALLERLDNELKYFEQALDWRETYLISNMLGAANIHPDSNNTVVALQAALYKALGKNPSIHCLYDSKNDVSYLAEIRICFNKTLQLTDCDGVKLGDAFTFHYPGGKVITNCEISKPVHYPSLVPSQHPPYHRHNNNDKWKFPIVNMYKLLRFIMWVTL